MAFQIFPTIEYWLTSKYSASESADILAKNVMDVHAVTIDFISEFADDRIGSYRYFEGSINGPVFNLTHKQYGSAGQSFRPIIPRIMGHIFDSGNGSKIQIISNAPNQKYYLLLIPLVPIAYFLLDLPVLFVLLLTPVLIIMIFINRVSYLRRAKLDKAQLQSIFNVDDLAEVAS
jgi:hypothetical protein